MQLRLTFRKDERLKSNRVIKQLFSSADSFLVHPFKVNWQLRKEHGRYPARALITISKKNFRRATARNHMKRLCREAYRKNKHVLYDFLAENEIQCDFSIIYIGKDPATFSVVEKKIIALIERLISELTLHIHQNTSTS